MKKTIVLLLLVVFALSFNGCGHSKYPGLPDDAIAFSMGEYVDAEDNDEIYGTIEYDGRTYMLYGTAGKTIRVEDIDACLGFFVQDGNEEKDRRLYTLVEDAEHNFLMDYTDTAFMEQPTFWRAVDTKDVDITIPDYIDGLDCLFWK